MVYLRLPRLSPRKNFKIYESILNQIYWVSVSFFDTDDAFVQPWAWPAKY